jgi:hypothetical protein
MPASLYEPLDPNSNEIRLLEIELIKHPVRPISEEKLQKDWLIRGCLRKVSLDGNSSYFALSYVWGDPSMARSITVNNQEVHVTSNLFYALASLEHFVYFVKS